ncbi:MAG: pyridoxal 5'-phosphate synthase glutaminase subunit PdxT [Bryobacter sp.]
MALQGDFAKHIQMIQKSGGAPVEVRRLDQLADISGLVIPGGESTTMLRLMDYYDLFGALAAFGRERPMFGTCAGAILMASEVSNPEQRSLALMDIGVERNAYGRQVDSRIVKIDSKLGPLEAVFIRAPIIRRTGPAVETLAWYEGDPVLLRQGKHWAATFHPELTEDTRVHQEFLATL